MEEKKTIFDYVGQVFLCFGFTMLCITLLTIACGEEAKEISTMFALGGKGIPLEIMVQFFALSALIVAARYIFFTDFLLKKASIAVRTVGMLLTIIIMIVCFIFRFGWFPVNMWQPWVMFLACFGISFGISLFVTILKERMENRKMEEGLNRLRKQWEAEENNSKDSRK